jgi:hypothetical protein
MGDLKDWAMKQGKFIKFESDIPVTLVYKGYKMVPDKYAEPGNERDIPRYEFDFEGTAKFSDIPNKSLAYGLDGVASGSVVTITRTGESTDTKYDVQLG